MHLLVRYSRACGCYQGLLLTRKLLNNRFLEVCVRHRDLVNSYGIFMLQMITDYWRSCIKSGRWTVMYLFAKGIDLFSVCRNDTIRPFSFMSYHRACNKSNTADATSWAGTPTTVFLHIYVGFTFISLSNYLFFVLGSCLINIFYVQYDYLYLLKHTCVKHNLSVDVRVGRWTLIDRLHHYSRNI